MPARSRACSSPPAQRHRSPTRSGWIGSVKSVRGAVPNLAAGPFSPDRFPNPACTLRCTGLSTSPVPGSCSSSLGGRGPGLGDVRSAVSVSGGADLLRVEQFPVLAGWPPATAAVAAAQFLPGGPAVFTAYPSPYRGPQIVAQVGKGHRGHAGSEVGAPAAYRVVEPADQVIQRLVHLDLPAQRLHLAHHRFQRLLRRVGVDVVPVGALLTVTLDAPPEEVHPLVDVGDQGLRLRQA